MDYQSMFEGNNLLNHFEMELIDLSDKRVIVEMPVTKKVKQPFGFLHGGATVALCETAASLGSASLIDLTKYHVFGIEINANHISSVKEGYVRAVADIIHQGHQHHVWLIHVYSNDRLISVSRSTIAVKEKINKKEE